MKGKGLEEKGVQVQGKATVPFQGKLFLKDRYGAWMPGMGFSSLGFQRAPVEDHI